MRLSAQGSVAGRLKMFTYWSVCSAFETTRALPWALIHNFEIDLKVYRRNENFILLP